MPGLRGARSNARFSLAACALAMLALAASACGGGMLGRQYEYDQQIYLRADGSASVVINSSIQALMALHGLQLDPAPRARIDREAIRAMVAEPGLEVGRVSRPWRRDGRQFIQIRVEVDDVSKLGSTKFLKDVRYSFTAIPEDKRLYLQQVGQPARTDVANTGWNGSELVAFKLHLPSKITDHNVRLLETGEAGGPERGNILTYEQRLSDRLKGQPLEMRVEMESGSILYRTLSLFALSFAAAMVLLALIIWRVVRSGRRKNDLLRAGR